MARKPRDLTKYFGHHVVSGRELRSQFPDDPDGGLEAPQMWRRIRHGSVITLLVALLVFGAGTAWAILSGYLTIPQGPGRPDIAACPTGTYDYVPADRITVNVFNAAGREGLAREVADQLAARKFALGTVDNERLPMEVTATIRAGFGGEAGAFTLQRNVPGSIFTRDAREDASVDLVLGPAFDALTDVSLIDQTPGTITCTAPTSTATPPVR